MNNPKSSGAGSGGGSGSSVLSPGSIITIRIGDAGGSGSSSFGTLRSAPGGVGGAITATVEY